MNYHKNSFLFKQNSSNTNNISNKNSIESTTSSPFKTSYLQGRFGNQALLHLLGKPLQTKLNLSDPDDIYEKEADRIADQVMRMPQSHLQRKPLQTHQTIQPEEIDENELISDETESCINRLSGQGSPISDEVRSFMEPRFGADFSNVRIHTDSNAASVAQQINAKAFTVGNDVAFNTGEYVPETENGKQLLAHELTHVLQQQSHQVQRENLTPPEATTPGATITLPASLRSMVGNVNYYQARNDDYLSRHTTPPPPDYYLNYGDRYARRFTTELRPTLSAEGQRWVDRTFVLLQEAIENRRDADPAAFDRLEQDEDAFREFAYGTHSQAYLDGGLRYLPMEDLARIAATPDFFDIASIDGISQIIETGIGIVPQWVDDSVTTPGARFLQNVENEILNLYNVPYF